MDMNSETVESLWILVIKVRFPMKMHSMFGNTYLREHTSQIQKQKLNGLRNTGQ